MAHVGSLVDKETFVPLTTTAGLLLALSVVGQRDAFRWTTMQIGAVKILAPSQRTASTFSIVMETSASAARSMEINVTRTEHPRNAPMVTFAGRLRVKRSVPGSA